MKTKTDFLKWVDHQLEQDPALARKVEAWLYKNRAALASVRRGIEEAAHSKARKIGSFAKHADEKI